MCLFKVVPEIDGNFMYMVTYRDKDYHFEVKLLDIKEEFDV